MPALPESSLPLVSVVMPAYNHAAYVEQAIRSVLGQTYSRVELVVVDDGSTDDTWAVIERVRATSETPFTALRTANRGVSAALNTGVANSQGALLGVLASDDYYLPTKLEAQVAALNASPPAVGLVHSSFFHDYGDGQLVDATGTYLPARGHTLLDMLALRVAVAAPSILFRREAFEAVGGFDEAAAAEDIPFFLDVLAAGYAFAYADTPLMVKRTVPTGEGLRVERNFDVYQQAVARHLHRVEQAEHTSIWRDFRVAQGRLAVGGGDLAGAWRAFRDASRVGRSLRPLGVFAGLALRHQTLRVLPSGLRSALRQARTARLGRPSETCLAPPATLLR